jgi:sigma-B regulation protein RsbQ
MDATELRTRHHVTEQGVPDGPVLVLGHGFGCDQEIWRLVTPAFAATHRIVQFDHVGSGRADAAAHSSVRHATIDGYAEDLVGLVRGLGLAGATYVGHSIGSMIGVLASAADPTLFDGLVLIGASARYIDDPAAGYVGGFSRDDVDDIIDAIDANYLDWAHLMAPVVMGNPDRPELAAALEASFSRLDPTIATTFARATFYTDVRATLPQVTARTLVVHPTDDAIVPDGAARALADGLADATLLQLAATGNCPLLSAPDEVAAAIRAFLAVPAPV